MTDGQWFAVMAKPRQETTAASQLRRQGYEVMLPLLEVRKRRQGKWTLVTEPLFPGYLFVHLVLGQDDPSPIRSTVGCRGLVRIGSGYVPVPSAVMTPLLSLSASPNEAEVLFREGGQVAIASGPFAGVQGIFKLTKGSDRAEVLISLLGQERPIVVAMDDLTPAQ